VGTFGGGIHDYHDRVVASGLGEFDDEVYAYSVPAAFRDGEQLEFSSREAAR
jgi:hypothetical protein